MDDTILRPRGAGLVSSSAVTLEAPLRSWPDRSRRASESPAVVTRVGRRALALARIVAGAAAEARRLEVRTDQALRLRGQAYALSRACGRICASHGLRAEISGPVPSGPVVMVANHVGYVDPVVLGSLLPCMPIAKQEIGGWPLLGAAARSLQVALVERGNPWSGARVLRAGMRALDAGVSVLNFPEGTTTHGDRLLPFRRGVFGLARIADVPVVPVLLRVQPASLAWVGSQGFLPHYLRMTAREHSTVQVTFGPALSPRRYGTAADLAHQAEAIVRHMLAEE